jgi:hypothetical protein
MRWNPDGRIVLSGRATGMFGLFAKDLWLVILIWGFAEIG